MQCRKLLICPSNCILMTKCFYSRYETCYTFYARGLFFLMYVTLWKLTSLMQVLLLKWKNSEGFRWGGSISQVGIVHALILIIKISFPPLATVWGVLQRSITYKWKSYLICENVFFTPLIAFPDEMKSRLISL